MAYDNTGTIQKNKYKKTEGQPDIVGKATINGVEMKMAGWAKKWPDGSPYYSVRYTPKDENAERPKKFNDDPQPQLDDDEIPF